MNKKTIKSYIDLIKTINKKKLITESQINRIKNALSRDYSNMSHLLANATFLYDCNITKEQKNKGAIYLIKRHLTSYGKQRKTSHIESDFIELIKQIKNGSNYDFTFKGFKELTNGIWYFYAPIYELKVNGSKYAYFHFNGEDYSAYIGCIERSRGFDIYCSDY